MGNLKMIINKRESSSILTVDNQISVTDTYTVGQDVPLRILLQDAISRLTTVKKKKIKKKVTSRL